MKRIRLIKIILICMVCVICTAISNCEAATVRMQVVSGGKIWDNITVSESYAECQNLNSSTSTLGTTSLRAHLTTDADWSAMAIFTVSQYGGQTSNAPSQTTGNASGIYNLATIVQAAGILEGASTTSSDLSGLFDGSNAKPYIRRWGTNRANTNFVGFIDTWGWYNANVLWGTNASNYPVSIKNGLFGVILGDPRSGYASGGRLSGVTFRPVIWN